MARGKNAKPGDTRIAPNGYHYTRGQTRWRLTHHIVAEEMLGRPLRPGERVSFKDGNRQNRSPKNLLVTEKGKGSSRRKKAQLEARIEELRAQLAELNET